MIVESSSPAAVAVAGACSLFTNEECDQYLKAHRIWKKHAPYLYDVMVTKELVWPSPTVDWFPTVTRCSRAVNPKDDDEIYSTHPLLLSAITDEQELPYLMASDVLLPSFQVLSMQKYDATTEEIGGYAQTEASVGIKTVEVEGKLEDTSKIKLMQDFPIQRTRCCPQNPDVIAAKPLLSDSTSCSGGEVLIYVLSHHYWAVKDIAKPDYYLKSSNSTSTSASTSVDSMAVTAGTTTSPLAWNTLTTGQLASCGSFHAVKEIQVWDLADGGSGDDFTTPVCTLKGHTDLIEDLSFHCQDCHVLASASDDQTVGIWDLRDPTAVTSPVLSLQRFHSAEVNAVSWNKFHPFVLASASSDTTVAVWDVRQPSSPTQALSFHSQPVFSVQFAPFQETVLASGGLDGRVVLWDLSKCSASKNESSNRTDIPPTVLFVHEHPDQSPISDFSWSPFEDWLIASVAENNTLHLWKMASALYDQF